jgi:hypothetical protein
VQVGIGHGLLSQELGLERKWAVGRHIVLWAVKIKHA